MGSEKEVFGIDLDNSQFLKKAEEAKGAFSEILSTEKFKEVKEIISSYGAYIGVAAASIASLKIAFDAAVEGEKIEKINRQFEILSKNAGIASEELRNNLVSSVGGLADDTDAIRSASKAIVTFGENAKKIPEIMNVARKVTSVFGGDILENFERLNQSIASQQTRSLKNLGIIIDSTEAIKKYSEALKIPVELLSEEAKQRAILNSVLDYSEKKLVGIKEDQDYLTVGTKKLSVAFNDFKETIQKAFTSLTPVFSFVLDKTRNVVEWMNHFASSDKEEKIEKLRIKINDLGVELDKVSSGGFWDRVFYGSEKRIKEQIEYYKKLKEEIEKTIPKQEEKKQEEKKPEFNIEEAKKQKLEIDKEIEKLNISHNQRLMEQEEEFDKLHNLMQERKKQLALQNELEIKEIRKKYGQVNPEQEAELELAKKRELTDALSALEEDYNKRVGELQERRVKDYETEYEKRQRLVEASVRNAKTASEQFSSGFHKAALDATRDMNVFRKAGESSFQSFQSNAVTALQAFGEGSKTASEAAKGFILGSLADIASATGQFMMLDAFKTSPVIQFGELAAGAALVALSGAIKGMAGSGSSGISSPSSSSVGSYSDLTTTPTTSAGSELSTQQSSVQKSVTINIHGSYFDTDQTRVKLMDIIRSSGDIDDFKNVSVRS